MTANQVAAAAAVSGQEASGGDLRESRRVKVEYLGSIPVENKATDLRSLQVGGDELSIINNFECRLFYRREKIRVFNI